MYVYRMYVYICIYVYVPVRLDRMLKAFVVSADICQFLAVRHRSPKCLPICAYSHTPLSLSLSLSLYIHMHMSVVGSPGQRACVCLCVDSLRTEHLQN